MRSVDSNVTLLPNQSNNSVQYGTVEVSPSIWVDRGAGAERLVDLLGLFPSKGGKYLLTVRGIVTENKEVIWAVADIISDFNSAYNLGKDNARANFFKYQSLVRSQQRVFGKILDAKRNVDMARLVEELGKYLPDGVHLEVSVGSLMLQGDPFMPVDPLISTSRSKGGLGWGYRDHLQVQHYSNVAEQANGSQAIVYNTFTSYLQANDFDSDTAQILQMRMMKGGQVLSEHTFGKKFPHTNHQIGSKSAIGMRDLEGDLYDPLKVYKRTIGAFGATRGPYANGGALEKMLRQSYDLVRESSTSKLKDPKVLQEIISKSLKSQLTGLVTDKLWVSEMLDSEVIFRALPEALAQEWHVSINDPKVKEVIKKLEDPGFKMQLKMKMNQGLKGRRFYGTEAIQKSKHGSALEELLLNITLSTQDRVLQKADSAFYGDEAQFEHLIEMAAISDPTERLKAVLGLRSPTLLRTRSFKGKEGKDILSIPRSDLRLKSGDNRDYLLNTLRTQKVYNATNQKFVPLLVTQEVDFTKAMPADYLDQLDPSLRPNLTKGTLVTFNGFNEAGDLVRRPLIGQSHNLRVTQSEMAYVLPAYIDPVNGTYIDPLTILANRLEHEVQNLSPNSFLRQYGFSELTGTFSVEALAREGQGAKELARVNGSNLEYIQFLAKNIDKGDNLSILRGLKAKYDITRIGDMATNVQVDLARLLQKALGKMGAEVPVYRDSHGGLLFKSEQGYKAAASMLGIYLGKTDIGPEEAAKLIAMGFDKTQFLPAVKQGEFGTFLAHRAKTVNGRQVAFNEMAGIVGESKRFTKPFGYMAQSLDAGKWNIALTTIDFSEDMLKKLLLEDGGHAYGSGVEQITGPKYLDEGIAFSTEAGRRKSDSAILSNLELGSDYAYKQGGDFVHKTTLWNSAKGENVTIFSKELIDRHRLMHSPTTDIRIVAGAPENMVAKMADGADIHAFMSIGEYLSKSGGYRALRNLTEHLGQDALDDLEAIMEGGKYNEEKAKHFMNQYSELLGTKVTFGIKGIFDKTESMPVLRDVDILIRNTPADQQLHRMSPFGEWNSKLKRFNDVPAFELTGKSMQDAVPEQIHGAFQWFREMGLDESVTEADFANTILGTGSGPRAGGSLIDQLGLTSPERQIQRTMREISFKHIEAQTNFHDHNVLTGEALQKLILEGTALQQATRQATLEGAMAGLADLLLPISRGLF